MAGRIQYGGVIAGQEEIDAVAEVLKGQGWGQGPVTERFERQAAPVQGRRHALFVNSGSSALLLALATLPEGTVVAMPALQFPTLYSAAIWCRLRPILVDCDDSLNMDPAALEAACRREPVGAAAFVHLAGNPTNALEVAAICRERSLVLIEDNCEGFGGRLGNGARTGNLGTISCASTHAAHQISTGEGGLVFCDDDGIQARMRRLRDWGRSYGTARLDGYYEHYTFSEFGLNLHASDIQAALGLVQLRRLDDFVARRRTTYEAMRRRLSDQPIDLPRVDGSSRPSWYVFPLLTDHRAALRAHLDRAGIETRTILVGNLLRQPLGIEGPACPVADDVFRRGLWFSVHPRLTAADVDHIVESVREFHAAR